MMKIYALKNTKVGYWNPPTYSNMDKDDTKVALYRYCVMNSEDAKKAHYDECELYYLGEFDDVKGISHLLDEKEFLIDLKTECFGK